MKKFKRPPELVEYLEKNNAQVLSVIEETMADKLTRIRITRMIMGNLKPVILVEMWAVRGGGSSWDIYTCTAPTENSSQATFDEVDKYLAA